MKRLLTDTREQLGWQGACGIALLILAGIFHMLTIDPLEEQVSHMQRRIEAAHGEGGHRGAPFSQGDRQRELDEFYKSLPEEKDVTDIMAAIYGNAEAYDVQLKGASFHLDEKDKARVEYVMDFPMSGEYPRIRLFVSHILANHPYLALDKIDLRRERISDPALKADVRLTLFLRPKGGLNRP